MNRRHFFGALCAGAAVIAPATIGGIGATPRVAPIATDDVVAQLGKPPQSNAIPESQSAPSLTFQTFVPGPNSEEAIAAALRIATGTPDINLLCIASDIGMGKTHLARAIENEGTRRRRFVRARFCHAAEFVDEVVRAYRQRNFERFRSEYRPLDLLVLDDLQFLCDKDRTQQEMAAVIEELLDAGRTVVVTTSAPPGKCDGLSDCLASVLRCGRTVTVGAPDAKTRRKILNLKSRAYGIDLPDDVARYLVRRRPRNVREMEGELKRVVAYSSFYGEELSVPLARRAVPRHCRA